MKAKLRLCSALAVFTAFVLALSGCGASSGTGAYYDSASSTAAYESEMAYPEEPAGAPADGMTADRSAFSAGDFTVSSSPNRKIIWTVGMDVETLEFDSFLPALEEQITGTGGYIESSSVSGNGINDSHGYRYGSVTARIPTGKLDTFLNTVSGMCNVTHTDKSSNDITLDYVDTETRKASLEIEEERLLALLEQATDLESIIQLESRLSEVRYQLDSYSSTLRNYDSLVDYSTGNISISEVARVSAQPEKTAGDRIRTGFAESLYSIQNGFTEFGIWLAVNSPFLALWLVFIGVIVLVTLLSVKRARKKAARRAAQAPRPNLYPTAPAAPAMPPLPPMPPVQPAAPAAPPAQDANRNGPENK